MTIALQKGGRVERGTLVLVGPGLEMGQSDDGVPILRIATDLDGTTVSPAAGGTGLTHVGASGMLLVSNGAELYYARLTDASVDANAAIAWTKLDKTGAVAADVGALSQADGDARYLRSTAFAAGQVPYGQAAGGPAARTLAGAGGVSVAENAAAGTLTVGFTSAPTFASATVTGALSAGTVSAGGATLSGELSAAGIVLTTAAGTPPITAPADSVTCTNLDADRLDGYEGGYFLDLANATGTLPGLDSLPVAAGTWSVFGLRIEGVVSIGVLDADGFSVGSGRQFNTSDDIGQLSGGNAWTNLNTFTTELDIIPAVAFRHPDDAEYRLRISRVGIMEWGDGASLPDSALYRPSAGNLAVMGSLLVGAGSPATGVATAAAAEEVLDVAGNVKVRGYVAYDDGSTQASAAYTRAEGDARYVHSGVAIDATYLGGRPDFYFTQYADNAVSALFPLALTRLDAGTSAVGDLVVSRGAGLGFGTLPRAAGVLVGTGTASPAWGQVRNAQVASDAAIAPSKVDFTQTVSSMSVTSLTAGSVQVSGAGSLAPSSAGISFVHLGAGAPLTDIPAGAPTAVNLDADRLDGQEGTYYLALANATGQLPGVASLPTAAGAWAIDGLHINGSTTISGVQTFALTIGGGKTLHSTDELVRLEDYNIYTNTNAFQGDDATLPVFGAQLLGDDFFRLTANYAGSLEWGPGTGTMDAGLYRLSSGVLSVWGRLQVGGSRATGGLTAINAAAALEVLSTTKGFLPPRMTTTQRDAIASPPDGLIVYNTTLGKLNLREAGTWKTLTSA